MTQLLNHASKYALLITLLACVLGSIGCGGGKIKTYPTRGRVVFKDGSPAHVGTVELKSKAHGVQARGEIDEDGYFTLTTYKDGDGAVAGQHDAVIVQFVMVEEASGLHGGTLGVINPRYASYSTSDLQCTIKEDDGNEIVFEVDGVDPTQERPSNHSHEDDK